MKSREYACQFLLHLIGSPVSFPTSIQAIFQTESPSYLYRLLIVIVDIPMRPTNFRFSNLFFKISILGLFLTGTTKQISHTDYIITLGLVHLWKISYSIYYLIVLCYSLWSGTTYLLDNSLSIFTKQSSHRYKRKKPTSLCC